ncbi:hypothetical protein XANCAGTX0491_006213 [Xanthoria calcicola]
MKLTTIVTVIAAIGAEVALASPVAQQAPVNPKPQPNCLPNGCYTSQAGVPASSCCSRYSANGCCKPHPRLLVKDVEDGPKSLCYSSAVAGAGGLTAATSPCPTSAPETKAQICYSSTVAGLEGLTAATSPCPEATGGVVSQISDGQVQAPTSASGNPVSASTAPAKGAADIVPPTVSTAVFSPASSSPTVTGPSTQLDTTSLESVFTDPILPTETGPYTFNPHFGPGLPPVPTKPAKPTKPTKPTQRPHEPGCSDSSSHKPYPTGTYIGLWDPTIEGLPTAPLSTTGPYRPGFDHSLAHLPFPTTAVLENRNAEEASTTARHIGPGWSHTLAHQPFPTTAVLENRNAEEATTRPYRPGFDHSLAHLPFPTTLATVVLENRNAEEEATTSARHIGPGWSHTVAWRPFPTGEEAAS